MSRIAHILNLARAQGADGALLTFLPDIRWACGFTGSNGMLVATQRGAWLLTDGRYGEQALQETREVEVIVPESRDLLSAIHAGGYLNGLQAVVRQADRMTLADARQGERLFVGITWRDVPAFLQEAVAVKSADELESLIAAQRITEAVFDEILGKIRPGMTEQELAAEIVYGHLRRGAEKMAFDPIVGSGPNGALPHARPGNRTLRRGDMVVIDMGGVVRGYHSDMTRTIAIGEPAEDARRAYAVVLEAQMRALDVVAAGVSPDAVDRAARSVIAEAGLGDFFIHSTGHGVGLVIHEWPRLGQGVQGELPVGAVITIEPGVYLPGQFGIRIEDMVHVTPTGGDNLTRSPKELIML